MLGVGLGLGMGLKEREGSGTNPDSIREGDEGDVEGRGVPEVLQFQFLDQESE